MKKLFYLSLVFCVAFLSSCSDDSDESPAIPKISIDKTSVTAKSGESVTFQLNVMAEAGFKSVTVLPRLDGTPKESTILNVSETPVFEKMIEFTYTVVAEDATGVLVLNFSVVDEENQLAEVEVVFDVELGTVDILTRSNYRWLYNSELIDSGEDILPDGKEDTSLQFNSDGTITFDIGAKDADGLETLASYTHWALNDDETKLTLTRLDWLGTETQEEYTLISIDRDKFKVSIVIDLSAFGYSATENVTTTFVAQAISQ